MTQGLLDALAWQCAVNDILLAAGYHSTEFGLVSAADLARMDAARAAEMTPAAFAATILTPARPARCEGMRYDKRFRMEIRCGAPATVERDGKAYCPGCDPLGEYVTERNDWIRATSRHTASSSLKDAEDRSAAERAIADVRRAMRHPRAGQQLRHREEDK